MVSAAMIATVRVVRFSTVPRRFSEGNPELQRAAAALLLHRLSTVGAGRLSAHRLSMKAAPKHAPEGWTESRGKFGWYEGGIYAPKLVHG